MSRRSKWLSGLVSAAVLTRLGFTRVSTGPAMRVRLAGCAGSSAAASSATAASTGTAGWQTATTWVSGPRCRSACITCSMYSSRPNRPCSTGMSRALCQSMTNTSWSDSSVRMVGRIRVVKCPDMGPTTSTRGWPETDGFRKCSRVPNGVVSTGRSDTAASWPSTGTMSMPKSGRSWVGRAWATMSQAARRWRTAGVRASGAGSACSAFAVSWDAATAGAPARRFNS